MDMDQSLDPPGADAVEFQPRRWVYLATVGGVAVVGLGVLTLVTAIPLAERLLLSMPWFPVTVAAGYLYRVGVRRWAVRVSSAGLDLRILTFGTQVVRFPWPAITSVRVRPRRLVLVFRPELVGGMFMNRWERPQLGRDEPGGLFRTSVPQQLGRARAARLHAELARHLPPEALLP